MRSKAQAARSPVPRRGRATSRRYDTGNPFGWLTAVIDLALADPQIGPQLRDWLAEQLS